MLSLSFFFPFIYKGGSKLGESVEPQNFFDKDVLSDVINFFSDTEYKNEEYNIDVEVCF